jgi:hypothetical protein
MKPGRLALGAVFVPVICAAQQGQADLADQLSNPVADLVSVPLQFNYDKHIGTNGEGHKLLLNIQPVIPIKLNADWNLISRTIVPVVSQHGLGPADQDGIGDILQSVFFSPVKPTASGLIWGAGPVLLLPTGTDKYLSGRKWGAGPSVVVLKQSHGWTVGGLANHVWSFAGPGDRPDVNATFLQPFLQYTNKEAWSFGMNTESTYDWHNSVWSVPLNFSISKILKLGMQPIQLSGGLRYWVHSPDEGPKNWGARLSITFLFPK